MNILRTLAMLVTLLLSSAIWAQDTGRPDIASKERTEVTLVQYSLAAGKIWITISREATTTIKTGKQVEEQAADLVATLERLYTEGWQLTSASTGGTSIGGDVTTLVLVRSRDQ